MYLGGTTNKAKDHFHQPVFNLSFNPSPYLQLFFSDVKATKINGGKRSINLNT